MNLTKNYAEIYPDIEKGSFLNGKAIPEIYQQDLKYASADSFV